MSLSKTMRRAASALRLLTVHSGIGSRGHRTLIGRGVVLSGRRGLVIGDDVTISDYCRISGGGRRGAVTLGDRVVLHPFCVIRPFGGSVRIGDDSTLNPFTVIYGGEAGVEIGSKVMVAPHTIIVAANHVFSDRSVPMKDQGMESRGVVIEDDVWIGAGCRILDGVRIGTGSIIAAGAVVTNDLEAGSVAGGVPARLLKRR